MFRASCTSRLQAPEGEQKEPCFQKVRDGRGEVVEAPITCTGRCQVRCPAEAHLPRPFPERLPFPRLSLNFLSWGSAVDDALFPVFTRYFLKRWFECCRKGWGVCTVQSGKDPLLSLRRGICI